MERVVSKNLFNYQLNGVMDEQLAAIEEQQKQQIMSNPEFKEKFDRAFSDDPTVDDMEAAQFMKGAMAGMTDVFEKAFKDSVEKCHQTEFKVCVTPMCIILDNSGKWLKIDALKVPEKQFLQKFPWLKWQAHRHFFFIQTFYQW